MAGTTKRAVISGTLYGLLTGSVLFFFLALVPGGGLGSPAFYGVLVGVLNGLAYGVLIAAYLRRREDPRSVRDPVAMPLRNRR